MDNQNIWEGLMLPDKIIAKILSVFPKFIRDFYYKHESVMLYLIVGAMTTAVSVITQYIPAFFGLPIEINTTISWICAATFAFFTNKAWVFRNDEKSKAAWIKQAASFYGARLFTFAFEFAFMVITVRILKQNEYIMKLIAQVFVLVVNYLFSKFFIFRKNPPEKENGENV